MMYISVAGAIGPRHVPRQQEPAAIPRAPSIERRVPFPARIGDSSPIGVAQTNVQATAAHAIAQADPPFMALTPAARSAPERRSSPLAGNRQTGTAAKWGLGLVYAMLAYEWLLSGLNKSLSGTFRTGLANRINGSIVDNPHGWYVSSIKRAVLPHTELFAAATLTGELLVAAGLLWGAMLWIRPEWFPARFRAWLGVTVTGALVGSAFMELNYYLLAGEGWPWLKTHDPFNVGLSVDGLMMLISLALIPVQLATVRASFARGSASPASDE